MPDGKSPDHLKKHKRKTAWLIFELATVIVAGGFWYHVLHPARKAVVAGNTAMGRWYQMVNAGDDAGKVRDYSKAESLLEPALQMARDRWPGSGQLAISQVHLAQVYRDQNEVPKAMALYQQAAQIYQKNPAASTPYEIHPTPPGVDWATVIENIGALDEQQGKYDQAEQQFKQAIAIKEKYLGPDHLEVALAIGLLAYMYENQSRLKEAETLYQREVRIAESAPGDGSARLADGLTGLADVYHDEGRDEDARPLAERALKLEARGAAASDGQLKVNTLTILGLLDLEQGYHTKAKGEFEQALALEKKTAGEEHPGFATVLKDLAECYTDQGKGRQAEVLLNRALEIRTKVYGAKSPLVAETMSSLSLAYYFECRDQAAEVLAKQALSIEQEKLPPGDPEIGSTYNRIALAYEGEGRLAEAEPLFQKALDIRTKNYGPESVNLVVILDNLARVHWKEGKAELAWKLHNRAEDIRRKHHRPPQPDWRGTGWTIRRLFSR